MVENLAKNLMVAYQDDDKITLDPATIAILISLTIEIIKLLKSCKEAKEVRKCACIPSKKEHKMISKLIRRKVGWIRWLKEGTRLTNAVYSAGINSTDQEIEDAYKEIDDYAV